MVKKKEKVCKLTEKQNYSWEKYFSWCLDDGMTEEEADIDTIKAMREEFPELKGCDKLE